MKKIFFKTVLSALLISGYAACFAAPGDTDVPPNPGWEFCVSPGVTMPFSNPFVFQYLHNKLMGAWFGLQGTWQVGGTMGAIFCFDPALTVNIAGRMSLYIGTEGSIQSHEDDNLGLTFLYPYTGNAFAYTNILVNGVQTTYGTGGLAGYFAGASARYEAEQYAVSANTFVYQRTDVLGDAVRVAWQIQNTSPTTPETLGLWTGQVVGMIDQNGASSGADALSAPGGFPAKDGYVVLPVGVPPVTEHRFNRQQDSNDFPVGVNFDFGQTAAYGLRVENGPLDPNVFDTAINTVNPDAEQVPADTGADEFVLGQGRFLLNAPMAGGGSDATVPMGDFIFPVDPITGASDVRFRDNVAYIQKFNDTGHSIVAGGSRLIVQYYRSTWGVSSYIRPYMVTVDAPRLLAYSPGGSNQITPNPMTVQVDIDNTFAYADVVRGVPITGSVTLKFPASTGLTFTGGQGAIEDVELLNGVSTLVETCTKALPDTEAGTPGIQPADVGSVDFSVQTDGVQTGALPYYVTTSAVPGGTKSLTGTIYASTTPRLTLASGSNLVTVPWNFSDSSWASVLQLAPGSFQAFNWDPVQAAYVVSTSAVRGVGSWIITGSNLGSVQLNPSATQPTDVVTAGFGVAILKSGWNLIANPYNYPMQLGQLVGVPGANNSSSFSYDELVNQGVINASLAYWDTGSQSYQYVTGDNTTLNSNTGYWIFVFTAQDVVLKYPAVYQEFVPGETRSLPNWNQSSSQWRLNLVARTSKSVDSQNYVGVAPSASSITSLQVVKPPLAPSQDVSLSIQQNINGRSLQMAQAYNVKAAQQEWKVSVQSTDGGSVTLTWPNISGSATNMNFRLVDVATNVSRDMRQASGYTYTAGKNSTRQFLIDAMPGTGSRAIIGNVVVSRPGGTRALGGGSMTILYTLSNNATTTVRVLSTGGRDVYDLTSGRADSVGQNSVTWNLRDNANRAVAPGVYNIEIVAETTNGDRVRKVVPVNVIR